MMVRKFDGAGSQNEKKVDLYDTDIRRRISEDEEENDEDELNNSYRPKYE